MLLLLFCYITYVPQRSFVDNICKQDKKLGNKSYWIEQNYWERERESERERENIREVSKRIFNSMDNNIELEVVS